MYTRMLIQEGKYILTIRKYIAKKHPVVHCLKINPVVQDRRNVKFPIFLKIILGRSMRTHIFVAAGKC